MSSEGGLTSQKHGGAQISTHGTEIDINITNSFPLSNTLFPDNQVSEDEKQIQNGADEVAKNVAEENLHFLSSDVDLDSYEREVVENNAEWLKSRCRNIETVDFDIAGNGSDPVEELFTDPLNVDSIPIIHCSVEGEDLDGDSVFFGEKSTSNDIQKTNIDGAISISFPERSVLQNTLTDSGILPLNVQSQSVLGPVTSIPNAILVKPNSLEQNTKQLSRNIACTKASAISDSLPVTTISPAGSTVVQSVVPPVSTGIQVLPQVMVAGNSPVQNTNNSVVQLQPVQDNQNMLGANLKLATISISTDKVANSTQILVNTSQGQQLYHINTADLTQATTALEPLSRQSSHLPKVGPSGDATVPMGVQTGFLILPTPTLPTTADHIVTIPIESVINSNASIIPACDKPGCDWAFTTLYKLRRHEESHEGRKDYYCEFEGCGKKFTTIYNLNSHKKLHERPCVETCPHEGCGKKFPTKRQLDLHRKCHSGEKTYKLVNYSWIEKKPFDMKVEIVKCPVDGCNKTFYSQHCMGSHPRVHLHDQDYLTCKFEGCGKVFERACRLKQHMRSHTGEKPYVCYYEGCGWAFTTASKLKRHQAKHTGLRKWKCQHCGRAFMRSEHLKGHMITHSGDRPYSCPVEGCTLKFTAKSSLYVHMKKHDSYKNEKITYHCPIEGCLKKYAAKSALRQHIVKHHLSSAHSTSQLKDLDLVPLLGGDLQDLEILAQASENATTINTATTSVKVDRSIDTTATSTSSSTTAAVIAQSPSTLTSTLTSTDVNILTIDPLEFIAKPNTDSVTDPAPSMQMSTDEISQLSPALLSQLMSSIDKPQVTVNGPKSDTLLESITQSVVMDTNSGSARTDFHSNHHLSNRAKQKRQYLKDKVSSATLDSTSFNEPSDEAFFVTDSSFTAPVDNTSQGITFRDPETGVLYIQTQLLQDDPPTVVTDLYSDDTVFTAELSDLPEATPGDLEHSLHTSDFTGSTINLEDLQ
ncbi:hypothetical protein FSP39_004280 [Pinctada imbricata]|uniref:C2H2-type domain-containing protein n=1 Tax=Pinctada imbricata TaxID=66713 RepID=A0AA89C535_PINIB|nr:hypothetical protein FSP39_004280 [Pinctada imbricata]